MKIMKERKKSLKTLLEGDFRPLGESKEGKLRGGFGVLDSNTNCGPNCSCTNNSTCPSNADCPCPENENCGTNCSSTKNSSCPSNDSCPGGGTTTSAPSQPNAFGIGMMGFF